MYNYLINEYVKNMTVQDIIDYGIKENVPISIKDASILLSYIKKDLNVFINGDPTPVFKELKSLIDPITYKNAYHLYITNKNKYIK